MWYTALLLVLGLVIHGAEATRAIHQSDVSEPEEITYLPGLQGPLTSRQFSGYINVDVDHNRNLFYWVIHSEGRLERDPVVLWLTGGPGCSSMDALIYEHGPFKFSIEGEDQILLEQNPYRWSKAATMIYVDSPAGAGLSYSDTPEDYRTNDGRTIQDLYVFLQQLFVIMPELQKQDLYLAGESYGGVYVPLLARKILDMNQQVEAARSKLHPLRVNLKGYMIGNGVTDDVAEGNGQWEFAYDMGLIDPLTYSGLQQACQGNFWNATQGTACFEQLRAARDIFYWVNPYDILSECYRKPAAGRAGAALVEAQGKQQARMRGGAGVSAERLLLSGGSDSNRDSRHVLGAGPGSKGLRHVVPCGDRRVALLWMSQPETRSAIHAASVEAVPWQPCSDILDYSVDFPISLVSLHKDLLDEGLRALLYSGDHDFVVPFTATRNWIYSMHLKVDRPYEAWSIDNQVAGFLTKFHPRLTFATIKGAGHMAPQTSPRQSLELVTRFLKDTL